MFMDYFKFLSGLPRPELLTLYLSVYKKKHKQISGGSNPDLVNLRIQICNNSAKNASNAVCKEKMETWRVGCTVKAVSVQASLWYRTFLDIFH